MKKKLSELTMEEFIDVECGDVAVLKGPAEVVSKQELARQAERLSNEFLSIASPASYKSMVYNRERKKKMRLKVAFFRILGTMLSAGMVEEVRDMLVRYGSNAKSTGEGWLKREVKNELNAATFELKRMGIEIPTGNGTTADEIRRGYEGMVADLMIANKMSIDIHTIRASVFASMVRKANEMARELNSKIKSHK